MNKLIRVTAFLFGILLISGAVAAKTRSPGNKSMSDKVSFEIPALKAKLVLSKPAYLAGDVEETPYQLLQMCESHHPCRTLIDERGGNGVSVASDASLSFSPDRLYLIVLRMVGVDVKAKAYESHYYEIYDLKEGVLADFQTTDGEDATTDNILRWSKQHPHVLEISAGRENRSLAYRK